jgi:predicted acetyltransferase
MVKLINIKESESLFGPSFGGKKGPSIFYRIYFSDKIVGEIEFSKKLNEILSLYIDSDYRNNGVGKLAVMQLFDYHDSKEIIAWASKSSLNFWKKIASKQENEYFFIQKLN